MTQFEGRLADGISESDTEDMRNFYCLDPHNADDLQLWQDTPPDGTPKVREDFYADDAVAFGSPQPEQPTKS